MKGGVLGREECRVPSFKMHGARSCLNIISLDPLQREKLKLHEQEGIDVCARVLEKRDGM